MSWSASYPVLTRLTHVGIPTAGEEWFKRRSEEEIAMSAPVPLRPDFDAPHRRALAKHSRDPDQTRRLLALATIYEGASRSEAARIGCVTLQIVRDWVVRFNARGPQGLVTGRAPGSRPLLNETQRQELQRMVDHGPIPSVHGVVRWRLVDLVQWVFNEFRITISKQTLSRGLPAVGHRKRIVTAEDVFSTGGGDQRGPPARTGV